MNEFKIDELRQQASDVKLLLEVKKLRMDIAQLKRNASWHTFFAGVAVMGALATGFKIYLQWKGWAS